MILLVGASTAAVAGPPFLTDDPEPVDFHHVKFNVIGQQISSAIGHAGSVSGEVNVVCAAETQCHFALPVSFERRVDSGSLSGLGDVEFGVKYRFLGRSNDVWSAAVYPTVDLPSGDEGRGLGNGRAQLLLPIWVQRSSGPWNWDAGIARLLNPAPNAQNSWFAGVLARRSFGDA